jgi:hypothetical protein
MLGIFCSIIQAAEIGSTSVADFGKSFYTFTINPTANKIKFTTFFMN